VSDATLLEGDAIALMDAEPAQSVDLVFGSPPYEDARFYDINFRLRGQAWVDWMVEVVRASLRVSRGLVAFVVEGRTRNFRWSATPALLMADLHRAGVHLRKPPVFKRVGIPGSGGPDWLRNDYEFVVCCTNGGKFPWSENTVMGHPPKWAPGGEMSNRLTKGARVNQWGHSIDSGATVVDGGGVVRSKGKRPSHVVVDGRDQWGGTPTRTSGEGRFADGQHKTQTRRKANGSRPRDGRFAVPVRANPGNIIHCKVGGGVMGDKLCHENEAPFPEKLAEFFVRSFCPPDGVVLDPFSGSGTTAAVALRWGRKAIAIDIRESQIELARRRIEKVQADLRLLAGTEAP